MSAADLIFAAGPILLLIHWMTKKKPMPSVRALPLAALVAYGIRLAWFGTEANLVNASVVAGLLVALTPILIVWGAAPAPFRASPSDRFRIPSRCAWGWIARRASPCSRLAERWGRCRPSTTVTEFRIDSESQPTNDSR
jgi:hypothetical protein